MPERYRLSLTASYPHVVELGASLNARESDLLIQAFGFPASLLWRQALTRFEFTRPGEWAKFHFSVYFKTEEDAMLASLLLG